MKPRLSIKSSVFLLCVAALLPAACAQRSGRALPPEARNNIHALFDNHAKIVRNVKPTGDGYVALTESDDPAVARTLKQHIAQMQERLDSGLAVRRWDPAFADYVRHYADIQHQLTPTAKGVRMEVRGRTAAAIRAAQNHARVISAFVAHGWAEHGKRHPAAGN